ncbi:MAG: metal-dependent hydrolase [Methanolinea sp.]|nr:metal-dependent hydrolase [Methanolinea sp.]
MDAVTHALSAWMIFPGDVPGSLVLYVMLGAIIPDVDILLKFFSDYDPRLFIFSHGGFTHSITGAFVAATGAFLPTLILPSLASPLMGPSPGSPVLLLLLVWAGAITHLSLDSLAYPGIPLLYPARTRKYTLGVFPGPSLVMFGISIFFLVLWLAGMAGRADLSSYSVVFAAFLLLNFILKGYVAVSSRGTTIPTFNPLRWMEIRENGDEYELWIRPLFGTPVEAGRFRKMDGIDPRELVKHSDNPEVRRLKYYSYFTIAERKGDEIILRDPLRDGGYIRYPPFYRKIRISREDPPLTASAGE